MIQSVPQADQRDPALTGSINAVIHEVNRLTIAVDALLFAARTKRINTAGEIVPAEPSTDQEC